MVTLRVYDFMGKLIQTFREGTQYYSGLNSEELNLSLLKGGVYTIQVATKEWIASKSLVIVKN